MPLAFDGGLSNHIKRSKSLNPNEFVAETVDGDVAVSAIGFGAFIEPWEVCIEAAAISIVVNDYVFTSGKHFRVEVLNGDAVIGWLVPGVKSWWRIGHWSVVLPGFSPA